MYRYILGGCCNTAQAVTHQQAATRAHLERIQAKPSLQQLSHHVINLHHRVRNIDWLRSSITRGADGYTPSDTTHSTGRVRSLTARGYLEPARNGVTGTRVPARFPEPRLIILV